MERETNYKKFFCKCIGISSLAILEWEPFSIINPTIIREENAQHYIERLQPHNEITRIVLVTALTAALFPLLPFSPLV